MAQHPIILTDPGADSLPAGAAKINMDIAELYAAVATIPTLDTAAQILAKLVTVDGAGSGLDADLLDGQSSAAFAPAAHTHGNSQITDLAYSKLTALPGSLVSTNSTMASAQNNLNLGSTSKRFRLTPAVGGTTLSGIVAGAAGDEIVLYNISASDDFAMTNEDANSTAANRILTASGTPSVVRPGGSARLWYDGTSARWRHEGRIA